MKKQHLILYLLLLGIYQARGSRADSLMTEIKNKKSGAAATRPYREIIADIAYVPNIAQKSSLLLEIVSDWNALGNADKRAISNTARMAGPQFAGPIMQAMKKQAKNTENLKKEETYNQLIEQSFDIINKLLLQATTMREKAGTNTIALGIIDKTIPGALLTIELLASMGDTSENRDAMNAAIFAASKAYDDLQSSLSGS